MTLAALIGVLACIFGAIQWGLLGLGLGLLGGWVLFLIGLFALYRRDRRATGGTTAQTIEAAGQPVKGPNPAELR